MGNAMKESPINPYHRQQGASLSYEEGWRMPGVYTDLLREHRATRAACGVFDISHLGKFSVQGEGACTWLEHMLSNRLSYCREGCGQHTLMLNDDGGIIDRLTIFCDAEGVYRMLGSAALVQEDFDWLSAHLPNENVELLNETEKWSAMAVYGPESSVIFQRVLPDLKLPPDMSVNHTLYHGEELRITTCGQEGDEGFELFCPAYRGIFWFEAFVRAGAIPCGMTARECLRLERRKISAGRDTNSKTTPHQARLEHLCATDKNFVGAEAMHQKAGGGFRKKRLAPLECTEPSPPPRHGCTVRDTRGQSVGSITSGCISPETGLGVAFAYLNAGMALPGTQLSILIQGHPVRAVVSNLGVS